MSNSAAALLHVAIVVGESRRDVAVSPDAAVGDVLRAGGVDPAAVHVVDRTGTPFDADDAIGEQMSAGDVLWVLARGGDPGRSGTERTDAVARRRRTASGSAGWLAGAAALVLCVVLIVIRTITPAGEALPGGALAGVVAALALGALGLALRRGGDQGGSAVAESHLLDETLVAPVLAFTAGFLLAPADLVAADRVAVVLGLIAGAAVAALRYAVSRQVRDPSEAVAAVLAAFWVAVALVFALSLLAGAAGHVAPVLLLGAVPLVMRALPGASIDVPDTQLLDLPFVARTASSVRGTVPRSPGRVHRERIDRAVRFAERRKAAGTWAAGVLVVVMAPSALAAWRPGTLQGWGTAALVTLLVVFLALGPRAARGAAAKLVPRAALVVLLLQLGWVAVADGVGLLSVPGAALVLLALAVGLAFLSPVIARGWRSVAWSRAGDLIEGVAVVLVLPAALLAAGAVEGMQLLTAG